MIKTRLEEIQDLKDLINNIKSDFETVFYNFELRRPFHKKNCVLRGCGKGEFDCECGFGRLNRIINGEQ